MQHIWSFMLQMFWKEYSQSIIKKINLTTSIEALVDQMMKVLKMNQKFDLSDSLNLINVKDFLNMIKTFKSILNLNTLRDKIILFEEFIRFLSNQVSAWMLINLRAFTVYVFNRVILWLLNIQLIINSCHVKLLN